ncbi:pentapeptide repeat-containing protein [Desulforhopalus sp. IMCC35007]|nr:pentapeptide repeat-containing protein [Desulforhopalus sp. IMCC35007]
MILRFIPNPTFVYSSRGYHKVKPSILYILLLSLCLFFSSCAQVSLKNFEEQGQLPLDNNQLQAQFNGKHIHLESIYLDATVHFQGNNKLQATDYLGNTEKGKWTLVDKNLLCIEFDTWYYGDKNCYRVIEDNGSLHFFTRNGAPSYKGTLVNVDSANDSIDHAKDVEKSVNDTSAQGSAYAVMNTSKSLPEDNETTKQRFTRLAQNCPDCNFSGVDLSNAQLSHANLAGANLSGADLTNANLRQANLQGANLSNAQLIRANLAGANLSLADLSNSDLRGSNLIRANVTNAVFKDTNLTGAHLESIQGKIQ